MGAAPLVALSVGLLVGGILSACSPAAMGPVTVFADPGKYQLYNCEQLAGQRTYWTNRELELKLLMDKADQGTGGAGQSGPLRCSADQGRQAPWESPRLRRGMCSQGLPAPVSTERSQTDWSLSLTLAAAKGDLVTGVHPA